MYEFIDLPPLFQEVPADSILSRTVFSSERLKAILFSFSPGTELSEHTAAKPAILHFLEGEADLTLGGEPRDGKPGVWVHMSARLPHSVKAKTPVHMLLLLLE
jgi:quercetin dioxygenase-like cupin family protein